MPDLLSRHQRHLFARTGMAATIFCNLAECPDCSEAWVHDYAASIAVLKPLYATERGLRRALKKCELDALCTMSAPRAFRSTAILAHRLTQVEAVMGFPEDCYSTDDSAIPGLAEAAERVRNDFGSFDSVSVAIAIAAGREVSF
jgi:hypothetical protein